MGLFDFRSREQRIRDRVVEVRELASKLNADYNYGIESVKYFFSDVSEEMKECNTIVGESEGFQYCFIEYYHVGHGKNDHSRWISKFSLRMNDEEFPDFTLQTKDKALQGVGCLLLFSVPFVVGPLIAILSSIHILFSMLKNAPKEGFLGIIVFSLVFLLFAGLFGFVGYLIFSDAIKTYKQIYNQGQYYIRDAFFREKYVILSDVDTRYIRRVFTEKVCIRVSSYWPEKISIDVKNGCIHEELNSEQLSFPKCFEIIKKRTRDALIFELDDEF